MPSSELAIELTNWALRAEQLRAEVAGRNIATASLPGAKAQRVDFSSRLHAMRAALQSTDASSALREAVQAPIDVLPVEAGAPNGGVALDAEVANLAEAELRYKTLAESLARELSLLTLAASGRQ